MDTDTSVWSLHTIECQVCRYQQRQEMIRQILEATQEHPWSFTMWIPRIPFAWPTTQKAICA